MDDSDEPASGDRVFRITQAAREQIAVELRYIDEARVELEGQQNPANREILRELRASADSIYDVIKDLEEITEDTENE